ncbi:MAG: glycosyltransferase, partial [Burkholderiales bacterium]
MDDLVVPFVRDAAPDATSADLCIAVVIPCFRVRDHILGVLARIGGEVGRIYAVDDACPDQSGKFIEQAQSDPRVKVLYHEGTLGVGGAVITGYRAALADGFDCIVKIDGDGQMDPTLLPRFVEPIAAGRADYTKGNRFFHPENVLSMPKVRLIGNMGLSFLSKISSGYWSIFDPTNGYTAISAEVLERLRLEKVSERYFFESDLLFRLNLVGAVVVDVPMRAVYADEVSHIKIGRTALQFAIGHARNSVKRIFYNYYLRGFSVASVELLLGIALLLFGGLFGLQHWVGPDSGMRPATAGTVMVAALPVIVGIQLLLSFINTFNTFGLIYLMTGGGPGGATRLFSILAYEKAIIRLQFGPGVATAFSMAPFMALIIFVLARVMRSDDGGGNSVKESRLDWLL